MNMLFLRLYYHQKSTYLTSEQIETIRLLKDKIPKYRIMRDFFPSTSFENFKQINPESTPLNTEIKKRSSKSWSKSVHISDPIPNNDSNMIASIFDKTEKICSEDLDALYKKEARRDEKNKANMTRLLATT
ncbi:hypothetical protein F8M41_016847 [Gigaspora margarita]|uniref:Uncharacterized protein n=1 Tax=Gigaspora margarita TaxID=4874 RepID=A0A8H4ANV0_GIGMA|nr:hypothetical protein F8M41_016847 [Gigaspora margarita]